MFGLFKKKKIIIASPERLKYAYQVFAYKMLNENPDFNSYYPKEVREINLADIEYVLKYYEYKYCVDTINGLALYIIKNK
jgi:hypothetical protein